MRLVSLFAAFAVVALLGIILVTRSFVNPDPLAYSRASLEMQQAQQAAQVASERAQAMEPFARLAQAAWYVVFAGIPIILLGVGIDAYLQRRRPLVRPDNLGQLPAPRAMIDRGELVGAMVEALGAYHKTQALAAAQPRVEKLNITVQPPREVPAVGVPSLLTQTAPEIHSPTLPDIIELVDVLPTVRSGHLAFGVLPGGDILQLPFARAYHILGAGDTRTGKTVLLDSMIAQLHHMATRVPLTLYGGDYKRELAATWSRSSLFRAIETEPGAIADMLVELVNGADGVHARYDSFKVLGDQHNRIVRNVVDAAKLTGQRPHISVVVLDEINAVLEAAKRSDRVAESLKVLLQTGAGAGVFVLGGAQYLSSHVFSRDGSKQFTSRALFGAFDPTSARMMFGQGIDAVAREHITGQPGRGLIRTVAQQQAVAFQSLHCSEDDILDAVALVPMLRDERSTTPLHAASGRASDRVSSALEQPKTALQETCRDVSQTPCHDVPSPPVEAVTEDERVSILSAAHQPTDDGRKPSRRLICERVFGSPGGENYGKVKHVLDTAGL